MGTKAAKAILKWFPDDVTSLMTMPEFKEQFPLLYWDSEKRKKILDVAFEDATKAWLYYSMEEMVNARWDNAFSLLRNHHKPYYNPQLSSLIMGRLLLDQCDDNIERTKEVMNNLIAVVDKKVPKKNTFVIIGPPSSGKSYFIHSLLALCWKYGQIRNNKKGGDSFTYQDAINCRAVEWNECLLMGKEEIETAKMVWEGCAAPINVKYKSNQRLQRTPIFVTSNGAPWRMCQEETKAFMDRSFVMYWHRAEWLKFLKMYPCPLAWRYLIDNKDDDDWWSTVPTAEDILKQVNSDPVNTDIFFDMWMTPNASTEEEKRILSDCLLYNRCSE